ATARQPEMRFVVSNTTEAGIATSPDDRPDDRPPATFPAKVAVWLHTRREALGDGGGVVFMPCELINHNGDKLREAVLYYADLWGWDTAFAHWVDKQCVFCNTLVDRIVPGYPRDRIKEIHEELGYEDQLVVEGEVFHLWVIEGPKSVRAAFPADRAGLNVKFVENMQPYRTRKVRILNGAHTTMVPVGYLYGLRTVQETVEHDVVGEFVRRAVHDEIIPTLDLPADELRQFAADVTERFRNPYVRHELISIALNSTAKFETRVLPSLVIFLEQTGRVPARLAFALAALIRFYKGDHDGQTIELKDDADVLTFFEERWGGTDGSDESLRQLVHDVLGWERIWKRDLNELPDLTDTVAGHLQTIERVGMQQAMARLR
ncbi:MAG: tagaturonate reductase, partial [Catalinimonas sp.]